MLEGEMRYINNGEPDNIVQSDRMRCLHTMSLMFGHRPPILSKSLRPTYATRPGRIEFLSGGYAIVTDG
jgi:hypothetical protein